MTSSRFVVACAAYSDLRHRSVVQGGAAPAPATGSGGTPEPVLFEVVKDLTTPHSLRT